MSFNSIFRRTRDNFDLPNCEFVAEKEIVSIIPNFNSPLVRLLSQDVGPFEAGLTIDVPLWIAVYLKQRQKCQVIAPPWLKKENLENLRDAEVKENLFVDLPNAHFMEIVHLLLQYACDDIADSTILKTLVCDITDARMAKLRNNMDLFVKSESSYAQINNLTQFEICRMREFFTGALDHLRRLQEATKTVADESAAGASFSR